MIPWKDIINHYYESGSPLWEILIRHSAQVAAKALSIARSRGLDLAEEDIQAAAMLHDIGICRCDAPSIECHGTEPYICHGVIGGKMLRDEGMPEWLARVAERHTGAGLSPQDIETQHLPLPADGHYMPETQLERLICYADKFFSKSGDMKEKPFARVRQSMEKFGEDTLRRFDALHKEFGDFREI